MEDGLFPHSRARDDEKELEEERRLCYVGMTRAQTRLLLTECGAGDASFGEYQATSPSRFLDEVPSELIELATGFQSSVSAAVRQLRVSRRIRIGVAPSRRARGSAMRRRYEDEDQSATGEVAPGARVRHAQFGVGTVISVEPLDGDAKIVVRFAIGQKTLRAKYARLQPPDERQVRPEL